MKTLIVIDVQNDFITGALGSKEAVNILSNIKRKIEAYIDAGDEVIAIGKECGIPNELIEKVPSDGLCGKTDEENLGFSYRVLNEYIRTGHCDDERIRALIDEKHSKNLFKLLPMPVFSYEPIRISN